MISFTSSCFNQLTSLMKYFLPMHQILRHKSAWINFGDPQQVFERTLVWMIVIVLVRVPMLVVIPRLMKRLNTKMKNMVTEDENVQ